MLRFSIITLGCKVNQYDGCSLATALVQRGLQRAEEDAADSPPDIVAINTCCVTTTAMRKSRHAIRRAVRGAPGAAVMVVGCYSDYDAEGIVKLLGSLDVAPHKIIIAGHHDDIIARVEQVIAVAAGHLPAPPTLPAAGCKDIKTRRLQAIRRSAAGTRGLGPIERFPGRQRAFVKVQDGCDALCTYCIVPFTRPAVWSRSIDDILRECRCLVQAGHREIVLAGVFLGAWGRRTAVRRKWDSMPSRLPELLRCVGSIPGLWRVRLSSLEPGDLTDDLLGACCELPTVAPHFHLPLQSGSPRILRRMNRQYTADQYRLTINRLRERLDRPAVTTDIIVGFPGETDEDFAETLAMARHAGFAKIHAFPFSAIKGTAAWSRRHEAAPPDVVKSRMAALAGLERELAGAYRRQFVGQTLEGLVERPRSRQARTLKAMTDRYLAVRFPAAPNRHEEIAGEVVRLRIKAVTNDGLLATPKS